MTQVSGPDELLARITRRVESLVLGYDCSAEAHADLLRDCYQCIAANAALAARCGELERDAERYRWLRFRRGR